MGLWCEPHLVSHAQQLGKRSDLHLLHDVGVMLFHYRLLSWHRLASPLRDVR